MYPFSRQRTILSKIHIDRPKRYIGPKRDKYKSRAASCFIPTLDIDPDKLLTFVVDVTKEDQIKAMVEKTVEKFGVLDVQVNNAGYDDKA
ncbi:MAG: SDR family oxidoreductase [Lachnospiraceae bacterium]|nr:SDR family oxidoreductase [Lachnospiraceae bacterium]